MAINKQDIYSHYLTLNKNILTNRKMRFKFSHPNLLKQWVMVLAVAHVSAGPGDRVLVLREGTGVRQLLGGNPPVRSVIVAVVDDVYVERA